MKTKTFSMSYKRKRLHKTDYKKRIKLISSSIPRIIVRKSLKNITLQLAVYDQKGDRIIVGSRSSELKKFGWELPCGNICAAYLTGLLFGSKIKDNKFEYLIADFGFFPSIRGSRMYAALKGVLDSGLKVKCDVSVLPAEDRVLGKHIADYANKLKKENLERFNRQFSDYLKKNIEPGLITDYVKKARENILRENKNG